MEMMDLSLEKLYKIVYEKQHRQLPEEIIGYIAVSVSCVISIVFVSLLFSFFFLTRI